MSLIKHLTDGNFTQETAKGVILVDFFAMWCAPCRMLSPILEEIAEHYNGKAFVGKVDIDQEQMTATQFEVTSVPTLILFKQGKEVGRIVGLRNFEALSKFIDDALL
jgi:thioredoxin 1